MMAINLSQARKIDRSSLNFRYVSPDELTDIIREATFSKSSLGEEIVVGNEDPEAIKGFLYPVPWSSYLEGLTGLKLKKDVLPAYLTLVMHANTTIFNGKLVQGPGPKLYEE